MPRRGGNGGIPIKGRLRDILGKVDKAKTPVQRLRQSADDQEQHAGTRAARESSRQARVRAREERGRKGG